MMRRNALIAGNFVSHWKSFRILIFVFFEWIGPSERLKRIARELVDYCKNEILLIDACDLCYALANTTAKNWFSLVCGKRHPMVWAKVTGYPYEPAKQMKIQNQNMTVHFFGDHKISNIPIKQTIEFSQKNPSANYRPGINMMKVRILRTTQNGFLFFFVWLTLDSCRLI